MDQKGICFYSKRAIIEAENFSFSDTIACIAGGIAEAYYKSIPDNIMSEGSRFIDSGFKKVINDFKEKFE